MISKHVCRDVVLALLALGAACSDRASTSAPTSVAPVVSTPVVPTRPTTQPADPAGARAFYFTGVLEYPVRGYTQESRFVLGSDSTFNLVYPAAGPYHGRYTEANGSVSFMFDGWNTAGPWNAKGTIRGDSLIVRYNDVMQMADFEDAVYGRAH